jgi:hypothetical protein
MSIASRAVGAALAALPVLVCTGAAAHAGHTGPDLLDGHVAAHFAQFCAATASTLGLLPEAEAQIAKAVEKAKRPSVIWLHFQECTGCTESMLRAEHPTLEKLILDVISLDYHETLFAAAGHQAEAARKAAMKANKGKYVLVVEGAIPTATTASTARSAARPRSTSPKECAADAAAVIAIGSCASWGGMPSTDPNPTGAVGRRQGARQAGGHHPRLPAQPVQLPRHRGALPDLRQPAAGGQARAAAVRLRPPHPRELRAPRPLRRRPLRARVRRRRPPQGLLPLQARLQGPGDLRQLLPSASATPAPAPGRWAAATPASAAPSRASASPSRSTCHSRS